MSDKSFCPPVAAWLLLAACLAGCSAWPEAEPELAASERYPEPVDAICRRSLAEHVAEQQRQEQLIERQARQLKECQRKVQELQEKLDRLADIERSLPVRPHAVTPGEKP